MSFHSPLLASLRRPGAEEGSSKSPAPSEEVFLRRRQTPGAAERPGGSTTPLFATNNNAATGQRPSPLGLFQNIHAEGGTNTPVGTSKTTPKSTCRYLGGATTPSSTGTNFKARLLALQAAGTPTGFGAAAATTTTPPSSNSGFARPGQLGWTSGQLKNPLSASRRGTTTTTGTASALLAKQQLQAGSVPPPVSSLEDELINLKLDINSGSGDPDATTPAKSGIIRPSQATTLITPRAAGGQGKGATSLLEEGGRTPTTTTTQQALTNITTSSTATKGANPLPPFSFSHNKAVISNTPGGTGGVPQWSPLLSSTTKGIRTKGKKAVGAGSLSIARSHFAITGATAGNSTMPLSSSMSGDATAAAGKNILLDSSIPVPTTSTSNALSHAQIYGIKKQHQKEEQEDLLEIQHNSGGVVVTDAQNLQRQLQSQLPIFGISEWTPPVLAVTPSSQRALLPPIRKPETTKAAVDSKNEALKELATLRTQADDKLQTDSKGSVDGFSIISNLETEEKVDEDRVCQGVRGAFRATLPELLTLPQTTPEAAAHSPSPSPLNSGSILPGGATTTAASSPLERGTRRGAGGNAIGTKHVAGEIEERLKRLKLLRNQAVQVTSSGNSGGTAPIRF